jgi:hypothetical protein
MAEAIWYDDMSRWWASDRYYKVLPTADMSLAGKLNAVVRLFVYAGAAAALVAQDARWLFLGIVAAAASAALYEYERRRVADAEKFLQARQLDVVDNALCARSTVDNPFMNPSVADIKDTPNRPRACNASNAGVAAVVERNFNKRLFRSAGDLWDRMASQRQFYTMPATTTPNDRESFQKWVYGSGPTCKEGNGGQCYRNMYRSLQKA